MPEDKGDLVRLTVTFTDTTGAPADPTAVRLYIKTPGGVLTTLVYGTDSAVVREETGVYHYDLLCTMPGDWPVRWEGTGAVTAAVEGSVPVGPSAF
jgi:hypothetical protein